MSRLFVLFILIVVVFSSCDGRDRKHKSNEEVLKENKLLDSFSESIKYIPETYTEENTDTILSNGFRVKIKTYTEMQDNVLSKFTIDSINYKFFYRNYTSELEVFHKNEFILKETINKSFFNTSDDERFWEQALLAGVYLDEFNSINNEVNILVLYCIPESEICKEFKINVTKNGNSSIKELDSEPIH